MRNLRKLTAVVIAIALVLTSMATAFAATTPANADKAAVLKSLDLYAGKDANDPAVGLGDALTTQDSLIWLATLLGYKADADKLTDAEADKALAKFADKKDIADYAKKVVAYSAANGIIAGVTEKGKFYVKPTATVSAARFATFILQGLGYDLAGSFTEAVAQLSEVKGSKVSATETGDLTRDAAVGIMYGTLTATKASGKTAIEEIVGTDAAKLAIATKAGLIVNTADLDVASVTATNLRELVITFNKAVPNADEAKKAANYTIKSTVTASPDAVTLSDDGKTVTLRTSSVNRMSNYSSDNELTILKAVGFAADKTIKGISVKDTTVPSIVSAKTTGPRNIKVTLSEPIDEPAAAANLTAAFKVDAGLIGFESVTVSGLEVSIRTYSDLAEGSHKIEVVSPSTVIKDNAGYPLQVSTLTFDYVKDTSPLTLKVVESNETTVTIEFNKAIKAGTFGKNGAKTGNSNVKLSHTYADLKSVPADTAVTTSDDQKFVIDFGTSNPFPPSATSVYIKYVDDTKQLIEDNYGNKLAATSFTINTTADTTKPTATAEFVSANEVKVTYSEDVKKGKTSDAADYLSNYVLKSNSDQVQITDFEWATDSSKVITLITPTDKLNGTTYTLTIKNVKDKSVAANQIDEVTLTFTGTDKVAPDVDTAVLASNSKFKIKFTEAMDVASITDKSVYKLNDKPLADKDTVEAVDGNKAVVITFNTTPTSGTAYTLSVGRVKDVAGNWTKFFQYKKDFTGAAVANVPLDEYQQISTTGVKLIVDDTLRNVNYTDFAYSTNAGISWTPAKNISEYSVVDGKTYITIVTEDLKTNTSGTGIEVRTVAAVSAENTFGSKLAFDTTTTALVNGVQTKVFAITDKCPANIVSVSAPTIQDDNKKIGKTLSSIKITYSEDIYAASVSDADYTVSGFEVSSVVVSGATVTVYVKNIDYGVYTPGTQYKIKQVGEIEDGKRNILGAQDEKVSQ